MTLMFKVPSIGTAPVICPPAAFRRRGPLRHAELWNTPANEGLGAWGHAVFYAHHTL